MIVEIDTTRGLTGSILRTSKEIAGAMELVAHASSLYWKVSELSNLSS
jgi:hypothetical protein